MHTEFSEYHNVATQFNFLWVHTCKYITHWYIFVYVASSWPYDLLPANLGLHMLSRLFTWNVKFMFSYIYAKYSDTHMIIFYSYIHTYVYLIADFGMSRDLIDNNYYITSGGKIPVKWTAPEVIRHGAKYMSTCT